MRTTLNLPDGLLEEAVRQLRFRSKTDAVILSLQDMIRRKRIEDLKSLFGNIDLQIDIDASRRRPKPAKKEASIGRHKARRTRKTR
ncbi:MAG: type II toxin-antitoxin system VapB family antitoxin [Myxococcaceae bacterium]